MLNVLCFGSDRGGSTWVGTAGWGSKLVEPRDSILVESVSTSGTDIGV